MLFSAMNVRGYEATLYVNDVIKQQIFQGEPSRRAIPEWN